MKVNSIYKGKPSPNGTDECLIPRVGVLPFLQMPVQAGLGPTSQTIYGMNPKSNQNSASFKGNKTRYSMSIEYRISLLKEFPKQDEGTYRLWHAITSKSNETESVFCIMNSANYLCIKDNHIFIFLLIETSGQFLTNGKVSARDHLPIEHHRI